MYKRTIIDYTSVGFENNPMSSKISNRLDNTIFYLIPWLHHCSNHFCKRNNITTSLLLSLYFNVTVISRRVRCFTCDMMP